MKLIIEILYLGYLLIFTFPSSQRLLKLRKFKYFPINGRCMMWCGVLIHKGDFVQWYGSDKSIWMRLNIRLTQAKTHYRFWLTFYISYFFDLFFGSLFCRSWKGGYYTSPYIIEEYLREDNQYYLYDYTKDNIKKFRFTYKERRILWKEVREDRDKWLEHIREFFNNMPVKSKL